MLLLYILFIALLAISFRMHKHINTVLIGAIFILYLVQGVAIAAIPARYVDNIIDLLKLPYFIDVLLIFVLFFLVSELLWVLGFQKLIEQKILFESERIQKLYILVLSMFTSNVSYGESYLVRKNASLLDVNSFLLSTLNIFSPLFILIVLLLVVTLNADVNTVSTIFLTTNVVGFFWLVKQLIDIALNRHFDIDINQKRIIKFRVYQDNNNNYNNFKDVFIIMPIVFVITIIATVLNFIAITFIVIINLMILLLILFVKAIRYSYESSYVKETDIYMSLFSSFTDSLKMIFSIINNTILVSVLISVFMKDLYFTHQLDGIFVLMILFFAIIVSIYSKRYEFGLITIFPMLSLFISDASNLHFIVLMPLVVGVFLLSRQYTVLKPGPAYKELIFVSLLMVFIYMSYVLTLNHLVLMITFVIVSVVYFIYALVMRNKYEKA